MFLKTNFDILKQAIKLKAQTQVSRHFHFFRYSNILLKKWWKTKFLWFH